MEAAKLKLPKLGKLREWVARAKAWQDSARKVQAKQTRGASQKPALSELEAMLAVGLELPLDVPEAPLLARQVREASDVERCAETLLEAAEEVTKPEPAADADAAASFIWQVGNIISHKPQHRVSC